MNGILPVGLLFKISENGCAPYIGEKAGQIYCGRGCPVTALSDHVSPFECHGEKVQERAKRLIKYWGLERGKSYRKLDWNKIEEIQH